MGYNVTTGRDGNRAFVNVFVNGKRFRFANGKSINVQLKASENLDLLKSAFELKLLEGWRPEIRDNPKNVYKPQSFIEELTDSVNAVQSGHYSYHHKRDCRWVLKEWKAYSNNKNLRTYCRKDLCKKDFLAFINQTKWSKRTQKNVLTILRCLINDENLKAIKIKRPAATLHKPIKDVPSLLKDIKKFNDNLYLCCLLTYGCLLRPHREVRELTWGDFSDDLSTIRLSGNRNKSGRNRVVPVPSYIREVLTPSIPDHNLFTGDLRAPNPDYFKSAWGRFKKRSKLLKEGQTLYSFRHTGAIDIYKRTGSIEKLKTAMGHSNIMVSLTYLRGLDVTELEEEDMPKL